jgi:hypothetical protein
MLCKGPCFSWYTRLFFPNSNEGSLKRFLLDLGPVPSSSLCLRLSFCSSLCWVRLLVAAKVFAVSESMVSSLFLRFFNSFLCPRVVAVPASAFAVRLSAVVSPWRLGPRPSSAGLGLGSPY